MRLFSSAVPYLLLVTFYSGQFNNFSSQMIHAVNESPYDGVAVPLVNAYDTANYVEEDFESVIGQCKKESRKHIMPWVFWNRIVGFVPSDDPLSLKHEGNKTYFRQIAWMDIYNNAGALDHFHNIYRIALRIAKKLQSPGIVVDLEAYNIRGKERYDLDRLASKQGRDRNEVKKRLQEIGRELADITAAEYNDATLWFLFTGLGNPYLMRGSLKEREYGTPAYVVQGMLGRAKEKRFGFKIVSGGEQSLGYCYESMEDLQKSVAARDGKFRAHLLDYPNLRLGGTIAPWYRKEVKKSWMKEGKCGRSKLKLASDFQPLVKYLLKSYGYVWIYGAGAAPYNPYNPADASFYTSMLYESLVSLKHGD